MDGSAGAASAPQGSKAAPSDPYFDVARMMDPRTVRFLLLS